MDSERTKEPWEKQPDEPMRCYRRFLKYRSLGPERSVRKACDIAKLPQKGRKPSWQYWRKLAEQWHWRDRAQAYDECEECRLRKQELVAEQIAREEVVAERVKQRDLLTKEAVGLRTIGRLLAGRILEVLGDSEQLRELTLKRRKTVSVEKSDVHEERIEEVYPGVLELVKLAGDGMDVGSKLYRLAQLDQPDEEGKPKTAERRVEELAKVFAERLLSADMDASTLVALRDELVSKNGKPEHDDGT